MLLVLALASTVCFVIVGGGVGLKLLLLARRTRELPEFTVGLGFFLVALVGYPLGLAALAPGVDPAAARLAFAVGTVAVSVGSASIFVFTWRVFQPDQLWARLLAWAAIAGLAVVAWLGISDVEAGQNGGRLVDLWLVPRQLIVGVSYTWTAIESLRWFGLLRRRLRLGLADPVVANRFLLWGLSGVFASGGIIGSTAVALTGHDPAGHPVSMLCIGLAGFATSISIYLAFLPPLAYQRRIAAASPS